MLQSAQDPVRFSYPDSLDLEYSWFALKRYANSSLCAPAVVPEYAAVYHRVHQPGVKERSGYA